MAKVEIDRQDLNDLMWCAFRYALGRMTYVPATIAAIIVENIDHLNKTTRESIVRDIDKALIDDQAGMKCDSEEWKIVKHKLLSCL